MKFEKEESKCWMVSIPKRKENLADMIGKSRILRNAQSEKVNGTNMFKHMNNVDKSNLGVKDLENALFSLKESFKQIEEIGKEAQAKRDKDKKKLNIISLMCKLDEIKHCSVKSLLSTQEDVVTTICKQNNEVYFYICIASESGHYLPLLLRDPKSGLTVMLFGTGLNRREAESNFIRILTKSLYDGDCQYVLIDEHTEYMLNVDVSNEYKLKFYVHSKTKKTPFSYDEDELHTCLQKKIEEEITQEEKNINEFLKNSTADESHMNQLFNIMKDYVLKKEVSMKILEKSVSDWTCVCNGGENKSIPFPYETMNYLLLPEVNVLNRLTNASNVNIDYVIDNPYLFISSIFGKEEKERLLRNFYTD